LEYGNVVTIFFKSSSAEKSNYRQRLLLRVRRERPCSSRATEKRDELAPSH
jgi:hypothetical protein